MGTRTARQSGLQKNLPVRCPRILPIPDNEAVPLMVICCRTARETSSIMN
jgi:hypothetical protein